MIQIAMTSRYFTSETRTLTAPDGTRIVYLARRFVPDPSRFATLNIHVVEQSDRQDRIASQYLGDPEQFWRICDANAILHPLEMTAMIGRRLRITLPEGIPAPARA
jgi:hypothetical protein